MGDHGGSCEIMGDHGRLAECRSPLRVAKCEGVEETTTASEPSGLLIRRE